MGIAIYIYILSAVTFAGSVDYYPAATASWKNQSCIANQTCDLKGARISAQRWVADFTDRYGEGAYNYGDTMFLSFETDKIASLENYGVVQYVKGCVYGNFMKDGKLRTFFPYARQVHNESPGGPARVWVQKEWIIDSDDKDPMYNSPFPEDYERMTRVSRHGFYRWNMIENFDSNGIPISKQSETERLLGFTYPPLHPKLYVVDRPGSAFLDMMYADNERVLSAKNISLDFKICIYKTEDIPTSVDAMGDQVFVDNPITCFDWKSREVYNWATKKYETPQEMSEECFKYSP